MQDLFYVQTPVEKERMLRIWLSVAAYAYEFENDSIMTDATFDNECRKINLSIKTGNKQLDKFFTEHFNPSTGSWIHKHPDLHGVKRIYQQYHAV